MKKIEIANNLAVKNNFDSARFYGEWKGFSVFAAEDKEETIVGYPTFILISDDQKARIANPDETFAIMELTFEQAGEGDDL